MKRLPPLTKLEQRVLDLVDDETLIGWVQELSRIDSVWRPARGQGEEAAARWVEAFCQASDLETRFEFVQPSRPNVIAWHRFGPGPTLMLEGHTDVVTEGDPALWHDPPFSATIRDGRIYGRGVNDMKAGLVCALVAARILVASGIKLNGRLLIGAVCDEEGEMIGIKAFVDRGWADEVDAAIICEPEENHLCICQKGVMWIRATIRGDMAHGAMPLTGSNSVYPLAQFLTNIQALEAEEIANHGQHCYLGQPSITPTIVQGPLNGEPQKNVMPGEAATILDIRLIPGQNPEALAQRIEVLLRAAIAVDNSLTAECELLELRHPTNTDPAEPIVRALAAAHVALTGREPIYGGVPGSTDGTILQARKGIPIVTCGPGDIHIPHHIDEWVAIDEIKLAVRLYIVAAIRYLGVAD